MLCKLCWEGRTTGFYINYDKDQWHNMLNIEEKEPEAQANTFSNSYYNLSIDKIDFIEHVEIPTYSVSV